MLRLATVGTGSIVRTMLGHFTACPAFRLEAVYSRREDSGRALAQTFSAPKVYTDLDAMLADPAIDLVYIASPNVLHYPQTRLALLAGKHVVCEKPFCTREDQALELVRLARERGRMLAEAVPTTYLPNYQLLKNRLSQLGEIRLVLANYSQRSSRYDRLLAGETPNVFDPRMAGGCLMDINYYNLYLTVALFGLPDQAVYHPNLHPNGIDTSGVALLEYPGFQAVCAGAKDTWGESSYQIQGDLGYLVIQGGSNGLARIRFVPNGGAEQLLNLQPVPDRWYYEVQALGELLLREDRPALESRLKLTCAVTRLTQQLRAGAGLRFPGDP